MASRVALCLLCSWFVAGWGTLALAQPLADGPAKAGEWGFHPRPGEVLAVTPPAFAWRPQTGARSYTVEVKGGANSQRFAGIGFNVFCPPTALPAGDYTWRYRAVRKRDRSGWSRWRAFTIAEDARGFPLPARADLLARIPKAHPRLFRCAYPVWSDSDGGWHEGLS